VDSRLTSYSRSHRHQTPSRLHRLHVGRGGVADRRSLVAAQSCVHRREVGGGGVADRWWLVAAQSCVQRNLPQNPWILLLPKFPPCPRLQEPRRTPLVPLALGGFPSCGHSAISATNFAPAICLRWTVVLRCILRSGVSGGTAVGRSRTCASRSISSDAATARAADCATARAALGATRSVANSCSGTEQNHVAAPHLAMSFFLPDVRAPWTWPG